MTNKIVNIRQNIIEEPKDKITKVLSKYTERKINSDKSTFYTEVPTTYFLENDNWSIEFFVGIEQFKEPLENYKYTNKNIPFPFNNESINKEMKFIVYNKLFFEKWSLQSTLMFQRPLIKRLARFINEKYPNINSFKEFDLEKVNIQWTDWLQSININIFKSQTVNTKRLRGTSNAKSSSATFLKSIINQYNKLSDEREEWEKDNWCINNLLRYGIRFSQSASGYNLNFRKINNPKIREGLKKYMKQRLIANNRFSWNSAQTYIKFIPPFINCITELEPTWNDLKCLERKHILQYIAWLNIYTKEHLTQKNANPKQYIASALTCLQKFLSDIQIREYDIAPIKNVRMLIFTEDKPKVPKRSEQQIHYVPDFVLNQLFDNINHLNQKIVPVVYTMFKTGLRISDVLELTSDCLIKLNNKYWIRTDIEKVSVKGHKIPIDDDLANMLAILIDTSKKYSNDDNNPQNYIFVKYTGVRKGKPYAQRTVQDNLNRLAIDFNITDESGNIYFFKNHAFRHTYAIKMINGGADIFTVQELLAHASIEMTMRYAKLLDDTKRKAFDKVVKQGIFSFDESNKLKDENAGEIPSDIIDMLYTNHKLNALDTPYGTCMQRTNGKCTYAKQPPCLTCNSGSPCKDLCVGAFEGDIGKYEIMINSTKNMIENGKMYNRPEMVKENEELLKLYEDIYYKISQGNMIYSRIDKLKNKF